MSTWQSERQLCDAFREWCAGRYMVHPECHGWDLILVDGDDRRIGVQAKLRNAQEVVAQCNEGMERGDVDAAAVLMPAYSHATNRLCRSSSYGFIYPVGDVDENGVIRFIFALPKGQAGKRPYTRKRLPMTPSSLPAGVPSPRSIKDGEFMLEVIMHSRGGYLTNKDFQRVGWPEKFAPKWLWKLKGRPRWEPTMTAVLPSQLDPNAYAAMEAKMAEKGLANV